MRLDMGCVLRGFVFLYWSDRTDNVRVNLLFELIVFFLTLCVASLG